MVIGTGPLQAGLSENAQSPILAVYSSSLANVYFTREAERLDLSDIERIAPGLLQSVVKHPGVGLVVGREGDKTVALSEEGVAYLEDAPPEKLEFLAVYDDPSLVASQLRDLAAVPNSGDLLVFGSYKEGMVTNFEDHAGAHGGLGGVQAFPFMAIPKGAALRVDDIVDATQLYSRFEEQYWRRDIGMHTRRARGIEQIEMEVAGDG
jgi:hypothetical protein